MKNWLRITFIISDLLLFNFCLLLCVRFSGSLILSDGKTLVYLFIAQYIWFLVAWLYNLYSSSVFNNLMNIQEATLKALLLHSLLFISWLVLTGNRLLITPVAIFYGILTFVFAISRTAPLVIKLDMEK